MSHFTLGLAVRRSLVVAVAACAVLPTTGAHAAPLQTTALLRGPVTSIQPSPGPIVRGIGDVNGDGRDDVALALNTTVTVIYGASPTQNLDITGDLGARGYRVDTGAAGVVWDVDGAGDMDRDGMDDLVVSTDATTYVVYGAATTSGTIPVTAGARITALTGKSVRDAVDKVEGIGDFDGDGYADLALQRGAIGSAIVSGGPRTASIPVTSTSSGRVSLIGASQRCGWVLLSYRCVYLDVSIEPAGDFDGDGLADLVIENTLLGPGGNFILYGRTGRFTTTPTVGAGKTQLPPPTRGEGTGIIGSTQEAGDVNGDGLDDVIVWSSVIVLGRRGRPATMPATEPVIAFTRGIAGPFEAEPAGDQDGNGTGDLFMEDGRLLTAIPRSAPGTVSVDAAPRVPGVPPRVVIEPVGDLDGDGAPDGMAKADTSAYLLTHQPGTPGSLALPATLTGTFTALDARGNAIPGVTWTYRLTCNGQTGAPVTVSAGAAGTSTTASLTTTAAEGDACSVAASASVPNPAAYTGCTWQDYEALNYVPLRPIGRTFAMPAGPNEWGFTRECVAPPTTYPTSFAEPAWVQSGSVSGVRGNTPALTSGRNQRGSLLWPLALDYRNRTVEFTLFMATDEGATPGEGMTVAFVNPDATGKPAGGALGWGAALLGFGGLQGVAVAFDTKKSGAADPSSNFVGFTNGNAGASLRWLQTADAGVPLNSSSLRTVKIVNRAGITTVFIDGVQRMQGPLPIAASSFLAFTASTTNDWQIAGPWYPKVSAS
jgi:FG-GAP-like repeat